MQRDGFGRYDPPVKNSTSKPLQEPLLDWIHQPCCEMDMRQSAVLVLDHAEAKWYVSVHRCAVADEVHDRFVYRDTSGTVRRKCVD